jgi:hypothetical protein
MLSTMRLWVAALAAATFVAGQTNDCEVGTTQLVQGSSLQLDATWRIGHN